MNEIKFSNNALKFGELELALANESSSEWKKRFNNKTHNECNMLMIALSRHATPAEIQKVLKIRKRDFLINLLKKSNWRHKWRATLNQLEPRVFMLDNNYTKKIYKSKRCWFIHYQYKKRDPKDSIDGKLQHSTVIGIPGNAGVLMVPTACTLAGLAESQRDLIIVRRCHRESYFDNKSSLLNEIARHLILILENSLHTTSIIGTSSGGLAAICLGQMLELETSVAIGASTSKENLSAFRDAIDNFHTKMPSNKRNYTHAFKRNVILAASKEHKSDPNNALLILDFVNQILKDTVDAKAIFFKSCKSHNPLEELSLHGITLENSLFPLISNTNEQIDTRIHAVMH